MGCGASTEFMNDPSSSSSSSSLQMSLSNPNSSKRRFIDACREQLHLAMADATCKSIANSTISPHHQAYVHLSDGDVEGSSSSRNHGGPNRGRNADHVVTGMSHDNDSEEYLENKPPSNQQVTPINHQSPSPNPNPNPNPNPRKNSPLQEISITSHGKLVGLVKDFDTKDGHGHGHVECPGNVISTSSSSGCSARFPPPRPPSGAKQMPKLCHSSSSSSLVRDSLIPPTPIQAWLCDYNSLPSKEPVEDVVVVDDDAKNLMEGSTYNSSPNASDVLDDVDQSIKSSTNLSNAIDEFIENLEADWQSHAIETKLDVTNTDCNQLESHIKSISPLNTCMRELSEHFDKSNEHLHMPTTPRMSSWQTKLLETIDRDIANILLNDQVDVASLSKDDINELNESNHVGHTRYEHIEF